MNIALSGYGKMGRLIDALSPNRGHQVRVIVDPGLNASAPGLEGKPLYASIEDAKDLLQQVDVAIEFTSPGTAADNIIALSRLKVAVVCGTTAWYKRLEEVSAAVEKAASRLVYASNFSLGVNLFYKIIEEAAAIMEPYSEYDVAGFEVHHNKKADSPSGTAKVMAEKVLAKMSRKSKVVYEMLERPPSPEEIHFASLRVGAVPGAHALLFDSGADTIELKHSIRNREGLASGAIRAAEWLAAQSRPGVYTMDDVLG
jgi:4-hydroxy-tetrahydrodipicolinate reductase